jgi:hypothetical protein
LLLKPWIQTPASPSFSTTTRLFKEQFLSLIEFNFH